MATVILPYGKENIELSIDDKRLKGVLVSRLHGYDPGMSQSEIIRNAMADPVGTPRLSELSKGRKNIVIIASDHTRPVPSRLIIPPMLKEIREGNPDADVTILVATGCHRGTTEDELKEKFGEEIVSKEKIVIHDCDDSNNLVNIGTLPSGGECVINRLAAEADLLISEGFIEPHFFAGFSGGRKSVLPGIAARQTVLSNHCSEFIASDNARTGIIEDNLIHRDMIWAAEKAGLKYIVNVVLNEKKEVVFAMAGDVNKAHLKGCEFLKGVCGVKAEPADIVISTNGGYPLDQNIYQAVKGMTAAESAVKDGGVIIMLAKSNDGHGGEAFYRQMASEKDIDKTLDEFLRRGRNDTEPDQWQTQIFIRVLKKATVIYVSDAPEDMVRDLHMIPARSVHEALDDAVKLCGREDYTLNIIPDGVSVMVY